MVQQPVQKADGGAVVGQEAAPVLEGPVAGDCQASAFVGGRDEPEQQLAAGAVQRGEADLVADDQVVAEQGLDDLADAVVREAAVEVLDQLGGGEVPDLQAGLDRGVAQCDQGVALAGAGWADQGEVLLRADPLQAGEVGPGRGRDAADGGVEAGERLAGREAGLLGA